ncbi:hypothetical protein BO70DRAFT_418801 [Aspergillus heteromorphus CBS 117.55]|uniref:Uncharacterized protein n=1 Tax=Aspergillus heteromorphus CBS 117.55 TaxID=1448321 RepID=A0A317V176_9EURO|nr:uncharacterized protein BO70DRAFT_418801 [Aspergillus heteromorphus CBS 117.55]PWY67141.1 hypothetical protein BO70DRAFT_418801 [Aspergillus heteromorphus CBS 117.55]
MPDFALRTQNQRADALARLADDHLQQDLRPDDRVALHSAARAVSRWTLVAGSLGLGLGLFVALRLRSSRKAVFDAFRARERPTGLVFADGRTGPDPLPRRIHPRSHPLLKPTALGDVATYILAGTGGLFLGAELGFLGGVSSGSSQIMGDPERRDRIERAFRKFRADVLRKEADALDGGGRSVFDQMF